MDWSMVGLLTTQLALFPLGRICDDLSWYSFNVYKE